jgi:hypothetical protein
MIKLFDISNNKVIPTEHCYTLNFLKQIMEEYPEEYLNIYQYLFYKTCPNPEINPFFNIPEEDKDEVILQEIAGDFSTEDQLILEALEKCNKLYETPTVRAYNGISKMMDRLAKYMENTSITHGRDGNINSLIAAAKNFQSIRDSFKGVYKDLLDEQKRHVRGNQDTAYDL